MLRSRTPRVIDILVRVNMAIAGLAVVAMLLHVVLDVVMREVHVPFSGTLEIVSYWYMVALVFLAIPAAQARGEHIQVELFTAAMTPRARAVIDVAVLILSAALLVVFTWVATEEALRQTARQAVVEAGTGTIVVWPTRWLVPVSMGTTCLICLVQAFCLVRALATGEGMRTEAGEPADV
ncbi:TRAP transporter small permease subunit [Rhodobacterales bacterium HKCCE2091]|nr:TRAP transporter small permease subunit [Rhodobacterales bacterium HKCCE2091]